MATLFHANNRMGQTKMPGELDVPGRGTLGRLTAVGHFAVFTEGHRRRREGVRASQTLAVCPAAPASLFAEPSQVASSFDLSYAAEMGKSTLAAIFNPSLA